MKLVRYAAGILAGTLAGIAICAATWLFLSVSTANAQITVPRTLSAQIDPVARLEEQLVNRLRATTAGQQAYIRSVVKLVDQNRLDLPLVVAIERYALRRNPQFALPFFERALKFEASKRGVAVPSIRFFASTAGPPAS